MKKSTEKVECQTPTPGKKPTNIDRWKYQLVRKAILAVTPAKGNGIAFSELPDRVKQVIPADQLANLGSVAWYTTTVKLDMETKGELQRVPGVKPQHLVRTKKSASQV